MSTPLRLLLCSAPEDEALARALENHLRLLERAGLITLWSARAVAAGEDRARILAAEIARAEVFVLLLSASFFSTTECTDAVMAEALRRRSTHRALVIPVLLRPVDWEVTDLRDLACAPSNHLAVTSWHDVDKAFSRIAGEVRRQVEDRVTGRDRDPPPLPPKAPDAEVGARALDAAIPARVVKGERTEVLAMVAMEGSGGLRALITAKPAAFPVKADEVRSTAFPLKFPHDHRGEPHPTVVTVRIESADFDPPLLTKKILVPPDADSTVCTLLVTPRRVGVLSLPIEVVQEDGTMVWSQRLDTTGAEMIEEPAPGYVIASAPLTTVSTARRRPAPIPLGPPPSSPPPWPATTTKPVTFSTGDIPGWGQPPSPAAGAGESPIDDLQEWLRKVEEPKLRFEEHRPIPDATPAPEPLPTTIEPSTQPAAPSGWSPGANIPTPQPTPSPPFDPGGYGSSPNPSTPFDQPDSPPIDPDPYGPIVIVTPIVDPPDPPDLPPIDPDLYGPITNANPPIDPPDPPPAPALRFAWVVVLLIGIAVVIAATRVAGLWP